MGQWRYSFTVLDGGGWSASHPYHFKPILWEAEWALELVSMLAPARNQSQIHGSPAHRLVSVETIFLSLMMEPLRSSCQNLICNCAQFQLPVYTAHVRKCVVVYLLRATAVEPKKQPLLVNWSETFISRQQP